MDQGLFHLHVPTRLLTHPNSRDSMAEAYMRMTDSGLWVHSDGVEGWHPLAKSRATWTSTLVSKWYSTAPRISSWMDHTVGSLMIRDWISCVPAYCIWPVFPRCQTPGDDEDLWIRKSCSSLAYCFTSSSELLTPVQGSSGHTQGFIVLTNAQESIVAFFIGPFSLVKKSSQPHEPRGKAGKRLRQCGLPNNMEWKHTIWIPSRKGTRDAWVWKSPRVGTQPVTGPFLVSAWGPCEPLTRSGTPLLRSPRSYWQEQETPTTQPLLLTLLMRWTLGDSLLIEIPQALLPGSVQDTSCLSYLLSSPLGILSDFQPSLRVNSENSFSAERRKKTAVSDRQDTPQQTKPVRG